MKKDFQRAIKPGDAVTFHLLTKHVCGGVDCACKPDLHLYAVVVDLIEPDPSAPELELAVLDVKFPDAHVIRRDHPLVDHRGETITTTVTRDGYLGRQSRAPRARELQDAPSGSWTPN